MRRARVLLLVAAAVLLAGVAIAAVPRPKDTVETVRGSYEVLPPLAATGNRAWPEGTLCQPTIVGDSPVLLCNDGGDSPPPPTPAPMPPPEVGLCTRMQFASGEIGHLCDIYSEADALRAGHEIGDTVDVNIPTAADEGIDWHQWIASASAAIGTALALFAAATTYRKGRSAPVAAAAA